MAEILQDNATGAAFQRDSMNTPWKLLTVLVLLTGPPLVQAQTVQAVLQRGYDANVSGANLSESTLNPSNVSPSTFGKVFTLPVDSNVYAQPLYVPGVAIANGTHNVLYVATMNDTVYAFDADAPGAPLWSINLASLVGATLLPWASYLIPPATGPYLGNLGILSTPVIDPSTHIMYAVDCALESGTMTYRLHAIDITTGGEPYGPGVLVTGSYGGVTFAARNLTQRLSLVVSGNQVVFGFATMQAELPDHYVGWVIAYNKTTLQPSGAFATITAGAAGGAGVWQAGRPPAVDSSGYIYAFTGNAFNGSGGYDGVNNFSESVLKLDPSQGLMLLDWFTPDNWSFLDTNDLDLSSSGPLLIPGTTLLAGGGKSGELYLLNTASLGQYSANDGGAVQEESITTGLGIHGGPVYWNQSASTGGGLLYDWAQEDVIRAYPFDGSTFAVSPGGTGSEISTYGGILALSANGELQGSGVLWALMHGTSATGVLHAYDAGNVSNELWNSTMNPARDGFGDQATYVPPLIANGKVYVATFSKQVAVYGLVAADTVLPAALPFGGQQTHTASVPQSVTVTNTGSQVLPIMSITLTGANAKQFSQTNTCEPSVAVGSACTISVVFTPTSAASMTATLSVNAGSGAGTQAVALTGTGAVPTYTVSPSALPFGGEPVKTPSAPQPVTVTNTGELTLPITSITLTGGKANRFSQTNNCEPSVAEGATCTINVIFTPTSAASIAATLNIKAGDGAGTQAVALSGTGVK